MRRLLLSLLAACGILVAAAAAAAAHSDLVDGSPGPGDAVAPGSEVVRLDFDALRADGHALVAVLQDDGDPVPVGEATVVRDRVVCARTAPLSAGVHTVEYLVTLADGHTLTSSYQFEASSGAARAAPGVCTRAAMDDPGEAQTLEQMRAWQLPAWVLVAAGGMAVLSAVAAAVRIVRDRRRRVDTTG